jgi:AcrR family transcriptional regulator
VRRTAPRKDAQRNRARILAAARAAFVAHGLGASTAAIARAANLGTATLYRHFPTRPDLIDAVFGEEVEHCLSLLAAAITVPDPWQGLSQALEAVVDLELDAPGLAGRIAGDQRSTPLLEHFNQRVRRDLASLAERLRNVGAARSDLRGSDIAMLLTALRAVAMSDRNNARRSTRRFIRLAIEGLR